MALSDWEREGRDYGRAVDRLNPAQKAMWARVLEANEWFDGESAIAHSALIRLLREWRENAPARLSTRSYLGGSVMHRYFRRYRDAWAETENLPSDMMVAVVPVASLTGEARDFVPPQYLPENRQ